MATAPADASSLKAGQDRRFTSLAAAAVACVAALATTARAETSGYTCAEARILVADGLDPRWTAPVGHLCEQFAAMKDVDPSARLHLTPASGDLELQASLGDGRVAHRRVRSPEDLLTVVEALTVVIPEPHDAAPASNPPPAPTAPRAAEPPRAPSPEVTIAKVADAPRIGVELGLALEGRLSGAPNYLSLGGSAYAALRPDDWFFGVVARWQPSEVPASGPQPGFEMESAGAGFVVARRVVKSRTVGLDAGASALVLVDTQSTETRVPDEVGTATDVRFGLLIRALIGTSPWKLAPSIDADLAPARVRRSVRVDPELPPLPAWSVALGIGGTWVEP
jgi:hypothetical protein